MIRRLLIANRGEIACRIIRTAKRMGIHTIAVYSSCDKNAQHVKQADESYWIGKSEASSSYLHINALLEAASQSSADAIHPGYGFLSESAPFAEACIESGFLFVGPTPDVIALMGDKKAAKEHADAVGIPIAKDYRGDIPASSEERLAIAKQIGLPLLVKAAAGGGGKGMRLVEQFEDLDQAISEAAREAKASFSDDSLMFEKFIPNARHIEVQIAGDKCGDAIHLFDRDCSAQRRHQKIIEEAPASCDSTLRQQLLADSITLAKSIDYHTLGTVEFLVDDSNNYYFMEMNTRLQVEHPVTEMITGIDCVELQLRLACGESMPFKQESIKEQGHAIELRLCAEDPLSSFLPSVGTVYRLDTPQESSSVRFDTGIVAGDTVSPYYDSMLAKLIVFGKTRERSIANLLEAMGGLRIAGVKHNADYLAGLLQTPDFQSGDYNTGMIASTLENQLEQLSHIPEEAKLLGAMAYFSVNHSSPWASDGWRASNRSLQCALAINGEPCVAAIMLSKSITVSIDNTQWEVTVTKQENTLRVSHGSVVLEATIYQSGDNVFYSYRGRQFVVNTSPSFVKNAASTGSGKQLLSPMPGTVITIAVSEGDTVTEGQTLMTVEAMKMEYPIKAPRDSHIDVIHVTSGQSVSESALLIELE